MSEKTTHQISKAEWRRILKSNFLLAAAHFANIRDDMPSILGQEAARLGVSIRTAYYLVDIHDRYPRFGIAPGRLLALGWTKLHILASYIDESNCEALLNLAAGHTARQLELLMRDEILELGTHCITLYLPPQDYAVFEAALISYGAHKNGRGLSNKEQALISLLSAKES